MKQQEIAKWLAAMPFLKELPKEELASIAEAAVPRLYKEKRYVYMAGDPLDRIFFIHKGKVKICKSDLAGNEYINSVLEPGDMFPSSGLFRKGKVIANAEILEDAQLIVVPIKSFEALLVSHSKLCIQYFKLLGDRIDDLEGRLEALILHNTYEQIILLLIRLCQSNGEKTKKGYKLKTKFTNKDLAKMIGTSRESVSRTLNLLKKGEYIHLNNEGFYFIDKDSLKRRLV
jgi:CRP/FNR family transcriptional regulator